MKKRNQLWVFVIIMLTLYMGILIGLKLGKDKYLSIGLAVIRPNVEFFECAARVHGNYQFYYAPVTQDFRFVRDDKICVVNILLFREKYIEMYGRPAEVFIPKNPIK